jgi:hypothetical protein
MCRKAEAQTLGLRTAVLDQAVTAARGPTGGGKQGTALGLAPPEPWPQPVNGAELLADLSDFFTRHVVLPPHGADIIAVWVVHTHCFECARHTPRLHIQSPEKGCGKTTVLDILEMVVCKPLPTANMTAAVVFRTVEACQPTLLVDAADTFLNENEGLRGVLNAGHKRGGQVLRCVGDDAEPRAFRAFAPAAIASIGGLPGTLEDRSVRLAMCRATKAERPQPIRRAAETAGATLCRKAARWAADNAAVLCDLEPTLPENLVNRAADNWRILFAIAEAAGGDWPARLGKAVQSLADADEEKEGLGVALLRDTCMYFAETACPASKAPSSVAEIVAQLKSLAADGKEGLRLSTVQIVAHLNTLEDRPWPEVTHGKPLTATRFTRLLKPFGIVRRQWWTAKGCPRMWGFQAVDFVDAFTRYLPPLLDAPENESGDVVTKQENQ